MVNIFGSGLSILHWDDLMQIEVNEGRNEAQKDPILKKIIAAKTLKKLKQCLYWVRDQKAVADWIANCIQKGPIRSRGQLQQYSWGVPFEQIAMDDAGPFLVRNAGNRYVPVVMHYLSKCSEVNAISQQEANTVVVCEQIRMNPIVTTELHSDQGRNVESTVFKEMWEV